MQFETDFACHPLVDFGIDFQQSVDTDILRKKYLGSVLFCGKSAAYTLKSQTATVPSAMAPAFRKLRREICLSMFSSFR
jgi:hypothetical protein